jgi:hypothetical protein
MELWIGIGLAFALTVYFLWTSRRRTSNDLEAQTKGLPDDLRDKNTGLGSMPNDGRPWSGGN